MPKDYLSNIDTALLRLEHPTNLMMVTGAMIFKTPLSLADLKRTIQHGLLHIDRFRQRVVSPTLSPCNPHWEFDPSFNLDYHVQRTVLPPPYDTDSLQNLISLLASTPLNFSKPVWQFHLVEQYGEGSALICRLHHCIADGMALVHVALSMTETVPNTPLPGAVPDLSLRRNGHRRGAYNSLRSRLRSRRRAAQKVIQEGLQTISQPDRVKPYVEAGTESALILGKFMLLEPDHDTVLRGKLGVQKRVTWSRGVHLSNIAVIRRKFGGGTVNDVLLTAISGALRQYLLERGDSVEDLIMRAVIPVNLRPAGAESELGNQMGSIFLPLPIETEDPIERLQIIEQLMNERKSSPEAKLFFHLLNALGMAPQKTANSLISVFSTRATTVITNVRGPKQRLYMARSPLETILYWVPQTGRLGIGVSIISYMGEVRIGVITDAGLVPDPGKIIELFHQEFGNLYDIAQNTAGKQTMQQASAILNDALVKLEAILEEKEAQQPPFPEQLSVQDE
ncbi:MAG: wax ester/triacylglycerol synthase family O-acyltransferase [Chloroflexota bacterium]|nr:wax ester/triacylglycerol synthase family O-acyltransferase [Chloroflexota bacterium]